VIGDSGNNGASCDGKGGQHGGGCSGYNCLNGSITLKKLDEKGVPFAVNFANQLGGSGWYKGDPGDGNKGRETHTSNVAAADHSSTCTFGCAELYKLKAEATATGT
jgi:hypothetical protein